MLKNNKNQSILWDAKYEKAGNYNSPNDFFKFAEINPTIVAIKPYIKEGMSILEVGSGTGELISYLQYTHPKVKTYGLDFSSVSISNSKINSQKFNIPVSFTEGDINYMQFENEHFDIVFGDQVLAHLDNLDLALKEIYRVTKKGGIVAFTSANKLRPDGWYLYKKLSKTHEGYKQESFFPWELRRILSNAGFINKNYYGEVLFLTRNLKLIKNLFRKGNENSFDKSPGGSADLTRKVKGKSFFKKTYHYLENITPAFFKVTIGVLARK
jgi:ubiquinone/menaquinone biosynthesis C-methylase UbiE